jgi:hypothetical protein
MAIFKWNRAESKKSNVETTEIETWNDRYEGSDGREGRGEESPKTLSSKGYAYWTVLFFDVLLSLLPVCFIGKRRCYSQLQASHRS